MIELEFHGAAQCVTGSMHLLHLDGEVVSLDCGLFQGRRSETRHRNLHFPIDPKKIDSVLLSHAHIDHSGNIPGLVRDGYRGPVYATPATCDLCNVMLADSAHIHEEDARFWNERRATGPQDMIEPLYTMEDALATRDRLRSVPYGQPIAFADGCTATFLEAGHILGSACVLIEITRSRSSSWANKTIDTSRSGMPPIMLSRQAMLGKRGRNSSLQSARAFRGEERRPAFRQLVVAAGQGHERHAQDAPGAKLAVGPLDDKR